MWSDAQDFYTLVIEDKTHHQEKRKPANQFIWELQENETHTTEFAGLKICKPQDRNKCLENENNEMGTNDKISQLCRMTRMTSSMWRGITLSKMEYSVRSTKLPNNLTHIQCG